jgi:hypothetical protein
MGGDSKPSVSLKDHNKTSMMLDLEPERCLALESYLVIREFVVRLSALKRGELMYSQRMNV